MAGLFGEFLREHQRIEAWLAEQTSAERFQPFMQMAKEVAKANPLLKQHLQRLRDLTALRNVLAHKQGSHSEPIAQPTASVVQELRELATRLTAPPALPGSVFHAVESFDAEQPVGLALQAMRKRNFSQVPVTEQGLVARLLTANTIMRWLASHIGHELLVDLVATPINQVLTFTERDEHWGFCKTHANSAEVLGRFVTSQEEGRPLVALLLTHTGTKRGALEGIVTASDLGKLASCLVSGQK